jgi:Uma2 family endonuclease
MPIPKTNEIYTYQDYLTWPDEIRCELIDGSIYDMSPALTPFHQEVVLNFSSLLKSALQNNPCKVFISPIDVVFSEYDVVQPDILVVCDPNKITPRCILGAPDLIIEVLSPNTARKDQREKLSLYEKHGVREYFIVNPGDYYLVRYVLNEQGRYDLGEIFEAKDILTLKSLPGIEIPLWEVFGVEKPNL